MSNKILALNPGSTSTKIALYSDSQELFKVNIEHSSEEIEKYKSIADQYGMRYEAILNVLKEKDVEINELAAVVGRGGLLPPLKSGAYRVNEAMLDRLANRPVVEHASNLGGIIAYHIAQPLGIPSFIYDSVAVDELDGIARISGLLDIERKSFSHALNIRAVSIKVAEEMGKDLNDLNFIVAHLGGGISINILKHGKMADIISDDEGPFSPERSGRVPCKDLISMCYDNEKTVMNKKLRGKGGLVSYLGTNNAIEVENLIGSGDKNAKMIYKAMAYQISKGIGELATVVQGKVDRIIITGGIAHSKMMTGWIKENVEFIAPVKIVPGENELEALAFGALRILKMEEAVREYDLD